MASNTPRKQWEIRKMTSLDQLTSPALITKHSCLKTGALSPDPEGNVIQGHVTKNKRKFYRVFFGWGGKAPPDPPLKRSFATFDRGGQTGPPRSNDFFSAPLTTRAPPGHPAGCPAEHPAGRPLTTRPSPERPAERANIVAMPFFKRIL